MGIALRLHDVLVNPQHLHQSLLPRAGAWSRRGQTLLWCERESPSECGCHVWDASWDYISYESTRAVF